MTNEEISQRFQQSKAKVLEGIQLQCSEYQIYGPYEKESPPCIGVGAKFNLIDATKNKAPLPPCNSECTCSIHIVIMIAIAIIASFATRTFAQFPQPSESIAKVYSEFSSCSFIDTTFADKSDPEGRPIIESISFAPVEYDSIRGFVRVTFNAARLACKASWQRREVQIDGDDADFYLPYDNPSRSMLDSLKSDGTITQLTNLLSTAPKNWGKADKEVTESKIGYYFKNHHVLHGIVLNEGALTVGWVLN
jgi:hypothetical protein